MISFKSELGRTILSNVGLSPWIFEDHELTIIFSSFVNEDKSIEVPLKYSHFKKVKLSKASIPVASVMYDVIPG